VGLQGRAAGGTPAPRLAASLCPKRGADLRLFSALALPQFLPLVTSGDMLLRQKPGAVQHDVLHEYTGLF